MGTLFSFTETLSTRRCGHRYGKGLPLVHWGSHLENCFGDTESTFHYNLGDLRTIRNLSHRVTPLFIPNCFNLYQKLVLVERNMLDFNIPFKMLLLSV